MDSKVDIGDQFDIYSLCHFQRDKSLFMDCLTVWLLQMR